MVMQLCALKRVPEEDEWKRDWAYCLVRRLIWQAIVTVEQYWITQLVRQNRCKHRVNGNGWLPVRLLESVSDPSKRTV